MLQIKDVIGSPANLDETELARISDELWNMGCLKDIKAKVSPELFCLHVGINVVGMWKGEGWAGIIGEQADFVPYIPMVLKELHLPDIRDAFEDVINLYPEGTVFKTNDAEYYDLYNFLQTLSYKVQNEKLKMIAREERREMVKLMRQNVRILDNLTEQYWSDHSEDGGWKQILDYLREKY